MVLSALPLLARKNWQWLHLTGANDFEKVKSAYAALGINAVVKPFLAEMELALGAATAAVSRAGASSLAEMAAMRLPSLLVPLPTAADNHQFFNARIYALSGAARLLEQKDSTPEKVAAILVELVEDESVRAKMHAALELWHAPKSAEQIAANILRLSFKAIDLPATEADTTGAATRWPGRRRKIYPPHDHARNHPPLPMKSPDAFRPRRSSAATSRWRSTRRCASAARRMFMSNRRSEAIWRRS